MKKIKWSLTMMIIALSTVCFAQNYAPANIIASFDKYYPSVKEVFWTQDQGYYKGEFQFDDYSKSIWFNDQGEWVMEQTALGSVDETPTAVYNAFASSEYADWIVDTVTLVSFPKWQSIFVIKVGQHNVAGTNQMFYSPAGALLKIKDVTNMYGILEPSVFLE